MFTIQVSSLSILLIQLQVVSLNHFGSRIKHGCLRIYAGVNRGTMYPNPPTVPCFRQIRRSAIFLFKSETGAINGLLSETTTTSGNRSVLKSSKENW